MMSTSWMVDQQLIKNSLHPYMHFMATHQILSSKLVRIIQGIWIVLLRNAQICLVLLSILSLALLSVTQPWSVWLILLNITNHCSTFLLNTILTKFKHPVEVDLWGFKHHSKTNALSICPDKIFFVLDKIYCQWQNILCPWQKFCPQLKNYFCFEETCLKPWTKFLFRTKNILSWIKLICLGQFWFCPRQKNVLSRQMDRAIDLKMSTISMKLKKLKISHPALHLICQLNGNLSCNKTNLPQGL